MSQNPPPVQLILSAKDETRAAIQSAVGGLEQLKSSAAGLQGLLAGATAALAGLAAVQQFRNFVSAAAAMDDLAEKTGASVEKLSALASVAKISGTSIDVVENSLVRLAKGLAGADEESKGAGNALAALGLKAEELKKLDTADALKLVADRLNNYRDGAGKTALAIDLLGKSGAQALPYLKDLAETSNLQAKLTAEQAAQAENLEKNLVRLSASTSGAWKEFAAGVLPSVDQFVASLLKAQNETGGLRDQIKQLTASGTLNSWAETAADGVAQLVDVVQGAGRFVSVLAAELEAAAATANLIKEKFKGTQMPGENANAEAIAAAEERAADARFSRLVARQNSKDTARFSEQLARQREFARNVAAGIAAGADLGGGAGKPNLKYDSTPAKDAKDDLKSIETYVQGIREQLVGVTDGEFEKMRQKAVDTFASVDFSKLTKVDKSRFSNAFAQVTEDIDTLEERARSMQWAKALAEGFGEAARAAEAADAAFAGFNETVSRQAQDLQFEIDMVGKLSTERAKLVAIRRVELDAQRATAAVPENASNREERIGQIQREAEAAKARVSDLYDTLNSKSRDGFTGLQATAGEYFKNITNEAQNFGQAFSGIMGSLENTFVDFAKTGKLEFGSLVNSIIADLARIAVRQKITAPLIEALGLSGGRGGNGSAGIDAIESGGSNDFLGGLGKFLGFRAAGGPVMAGGSYIVGEKGPELFTPNVAGAITPNSALGAPTVNIINNGPPVSAQAQPPRIDGGRLVLDVVLNAARTDADFRNTLRSSMGAPA